MVYTATAAEQQFVNALIVAHGGVIAFQVMHYLAKQMKGKVDHGMGHDVSSEMMIGGVLASVWLATNPLPTGLPERYVARAMFIAGASKLLVESIRTVKAAHTLIQFSQGD
tara:strand:+ start:94 stop:426 length:333 start_codon:yes stop_codon:yes gene_type:complete